MGALCRSQHSPPKTSHLPKVSGHLLSLLLTECGTLRDTGEELQTELPPTLRGIWGLASARPGSRPRRKASEGGDLQRSGPAKEKIV